MSSHATESLMSPRKSWPGKHRKRRLEAATYRAAQSLRTYLLPAVFLLNISGTPVLPLIAPAGSQPQPSRNYTLQTADRKPAFGNRLPASRGPSPLKQRQRSPGSLLPVFSIFSALILRGSPVACGELACSQGSCQAASLPCSARRASPGAALMEST